MTNGIYIHWPFCEHKCPYCDFCSVGREDPVFETAREHYLAALIDEIETSPARLQMQGRPAADSIYFGGGTPSLMGPEAAAHILTALRSVFDITSDAEITLEINPTTAETADLPAMMALGVNRLSVGAQSFNDRVLRALGRVHDARTTRQAIDQMRRAGAANLSLDLIFGAPTQTLDDFKHDLEEVLRFAPEHVSAYGMTIHEGTCFAQWRAQGRLSLPDDEEQAAMFEWLMDRLAEAGYEHYEISNWARPGRASRHNSKYWRQCDVYGFGAAAHGVVGGRRYRNPGDLGNYLDLAARRLAEPEEPPASGRAQTGEIMMLALRRVTGVEWGEINRWAGQDLRAVYGPELARLCQDRLLSDDGKEVGLTRRGILLADLVMERFF